MKQTGNFCIRALCAIFVGVVLGCSGGGGGSEIDDNKGQQGGNGGNEQETNTYPNYYITEEFGGQRFVEAGTNWQSDSQGFTKYSERCDKADQYINDKVAELNQLWEENNIGSTLSTQIYTALSNFNNGASISEKVNNNYAALAPVFVTYGR